MKINVEPNLFAYTPLSLSIFLLFVTSILGCGVLPQGEVTAMTFTVSGFTLPAEMAYSGDPMVQGAITSISRTKGEAIKVVTDLIMNAVTDVLQEQGRNAFLPDGVIQQILQQLNVTTEYTPLECKTATKDRGNAGQPMAMMPDGCFIIDGLVTGLCNANGCMLMAAVMNVSPIPDKYRTIKGSVRTSNVIMANWSKQMWQSVMRRVFQRITTERLGEYFSTAIVTVNN